MKAFFRVIGKTHKYFLIVFILLINQSKSKSIIELTDFSANRVCDKINFDVHESSEYISDDFRYQLCKNHFPDYDKNNKISEIKKCLSSDCNYISAVNPCAVECAFTDPPVSIVFRPSNQSMLTDYWNRDDWFEEDNPCPIMKQCDQISRTYQYKYSIHMKDPSQRCGPKHFCDLNGCCVERVVTSTPMKTTIDIQTTTAISDQSTTTQVNTMTSEITSFTSTRPSTPITTTTVGTTTQSLPMCTKVGSFRDPNDSTNRKYYKCVLRSQLLVCPVGQVFNETTSQCYGKSSTQTPEMTTITPTTPTTSITTTTQSTTTSMSTSSEAPDTNPEKKYIKCTEEGYFADPYNCKKFYRCYKNDEMDDHLILAFFKCPPNQLWDQHVSSCIREKDYTHEYGVCKPIPLPSD